MRGNWQTPDIVERLRLQARRSNDRWGLYEASAVEIERLRDLLAQRGSPCMRCGKAMVADNRAICLCGVMGKARGSDG